jgi:hypothetical protein
MPMSVADMGRPKAELVLTEEERRHFTLYRQG